MAAPTTIATKKYQPITRKYQSIHIRRCFKICSTKDLCWSLFLIKYQVFSLQLYQKEILTQLYSCEIVKNTFFLSNTSGRMLLEGHKILLKQVSMAIPNNISKAYQKGFVICCLRSTYGRFMEFLIETL